MQMGNRGALCGSIVRYNVLQKRKVYLDSIAQGLEDFGIFSAMKFFPDIFIDMFVPSQSGDMVASDVIGMMRIAKKMSKEEEEVWELLKKCVGELNKYGQYIAFV